MEEIRAATMRVIQEKITGQDVTEEFIDLEARIKNQKALETQFLEIMKAPEKSRTRWKSRGQLADVRTEIEKLAGRKRFLENQASLSTINVTLQSPAQIINEAGFWYSIRSAFSDGVDCGGSDRSLPDSVCHCPASAPYFHRAPDWIGYQVRY